MDTARLSSGKASIELIRGDSLDVLEGLEPGSLDVAVTSPPYNLGIAYGRYDDGGERADYLEWTRRWTTLLERALSSGSSFFLNVGGKPSDPWGPFEVALVCRERFVLQNTITWVKSIAIETADSTLAIGHYKPINSKRFLNDCTELVFHFTKRGDVELDRLAVGVAYADKSNVTRWKAAREDVHCRGNAWYVPYRTIQSRSRERPHPASYPPRLAEMALRLHGLSRIRRSIDPFSGIGSTALACAALGVDHLGIEIDPAYHREAVRRVRALQHEPADLAAQRD